MSEIRKALGLFTSVIRSGEPWTHQCQAAYESAIAEEESVLAQMEKAETLLERANKDCEDWYTRYENLRSNKDKAEARVKELDGELAACEVELEIRTESCNTAQAKVEELLADKGEPK